MSAQPRSRFAEWTQTAANLAVIASALVVVPLYMVQRRDGDELERQQLAAQMFQRKYEDRVMSAYIRVGDAFDKNNALFPIFSGAQEEGKAELAQRIIADAGIENIKIVIDYYNDLIVCIDQRVCDRALATSLIGQDVRNFYCKARFVGLPQLRDRYAYPGYGERLARFAGACDDVRPAAPA
jgi:hypothetical protein